MLRLIAELTQLPPDPTQRMRHLLEGMGRMLRARAVWTTRYRSEGPGRRIQPYAGLQIGWDASEFEAAMTIAADDPLHDFVTEDMYQKNEWPAMFYTPRLDSRRKRKRAEAYARNCEEVGGDLELIYNHPTGTPGHLSALGLQRPAGDRTPFSAREMQIAKLLWEQVGFLHAKPLAAVRDELWGTRLPTRPAQVLELVLTGQSVKQIARRLDLSRHTVNDHMKDLHRRFGVSSRGELMAAFVRHRGNSPPI
jgi:DNA-binding CsgD family transcriptional regulator